MSGDNLQNNTNTNTNKEELSESLTELESTPTEASPPKPFVREDLLSKLLVPSRKSDESPPESTVSSTATDDICDSYTEFEIFLRNLANNQPIQDNLLSCLPSPSQKSQDNPINNTISSTNTADVSDTYTDFESELISKAQVCNMQSSPDVGDLVLPRKVLDNSPMNSGVPSTNTDDNTLSEIEAQFFRTEQEDCANRSSLDDADLLMRLLTPYKKFDDSILNDTISSTNTDDVTDTVIELEEYKMSQSTPDIKINNMSLNSIEDCSTLCEQQKEETEADEQETTICFIRNLFEDFDANES